MGEGLGRLGRPWPGRAAEPTEEEWQDVTDFMKENSPKRWQMYQSAPEGHQGRLRGPIYSAWKNITRLKDSDPEMYKVRLSRLPIEDEIFAIVGEMKKSGEHSESLRLKLREKVAEFMASRMDERKLRISRLEKALQEERSALAEFESKRESAIDARTREVIADGPGALKERQDRPDDGSREGPVSRDAEKIPTR